MERKQFDIIRDNKKVSCDALATYHDDKTSKDFIIYTDKSLNNGKLNTYYALYKEVNNNIELIEITDPADELIALKIIKELSKDIK